MNAEGFLNKMAIPTAILDKLMLIVDFLGVDTYYARTYVAKNSNITILSESLPHRLWTELTLTIDHNVVLLVRYKEYSCITPLHTRIFKRKKEIEPILNKILESPEFKTAFEQRIS